MPITTSQNPYRPDFRPGVMPGRNMRKVIALTIMVPVNIPIGVDSQIPKFTRSGLFSCVPNIANIGDELNAVTQYPFNATQINKEKAINIIVVKPMEP